MWFTAFAVLDLHGLKYDLQLWQLELHVGDERMILDHK